MRPPRPSRALVGVLASTLTISLLALAPAPSAHSATAELGCEEGLVQKTLDSGAAWRMCARIHPIKGLVLENVEFKPATASYEYEGYKRVLDQIYLAQLNVPYDSGTAAYNDIPEFGFGGMYLVEQVPALCRGSAMDVSQSYLFAGQLVERTMPGICVDQVDAGLGSHAQESQFGSGPRFVEQGTALEVSSLSKISWYEYQQKVTFGDHGQIEVGLGATGDLAPGTQFFPDDPALGWPLGPSTDGPQNYAASHWHNAVYRVDFGIDAGQTQRVEQWDYAETGTGQAPVIKGTGVAKNAAFSSVPGQGHDELTWWRVSNPDSLNRDGHPRSYEIVNRNPPDRFNPITSPLVSFTNDASCQEYAGDNLNPECPNQSVLDYVAGDDAPLDDPVAWVNVGFHHVDRDEDQSPMPVHWQSFQLVPRDFFAQSPTILPARQCINGLTEGVDTSARPCVATNQQPPTITADSSPIKPGTTLTADPGLWNTSRTTWDYANVWFRNGTAIVNTDASGEPVPAVGSTYVVTDADRGTSLTVKVTASHVGFPSGTAESPPVAITAAPRTTPVVALSAPASAYGRTVNATVTVSSGATGTVTLTLNGRSLGTKTLTAGRTAYALPRTTNPGRWTLRAVYNGNATLNATSRTVTWTVTKTRPGTVKTKITKKPSSKKKGKATVTIARPAGLAAPAGKVTITLKKGKKTLRVKGTVRNGKAVVTLPKTARGTWKITTTYNGDTRYLPAKAKTLKHKSK